MSESREIRVQHLELGNFHDGRLYQLKQGWLLLLKLSNNLIHQSCKLFSNLPPEKGARFERNKFYEHELKAHDHTDPFCAHFQLECHTPGAYRYFFTRANDTHKALGGCDFLVDPELVLADGQVVDLNGLQMQTVLTKLLGPLDEWKSRLRLAKETGYNIIHFTPVQELSRESNSSYSIRDHLQLMPSASVDSKFNMHSVKELIAGLYNEWNVFSLCDLVYNHMANDSEFLIRSPDSAYNMRNSPHLRPAFVLDRILYHFTLDIMNGKYETQGIANGQIRADQLELLRHILQDQLIPKYRLYEFFTFDLNEILAKIDMLNDGSALSNNANDNNNATLDDLHLIQDEQYRRLKSSVDLKLASLLRSRFGRDAVRARLAQIDEQTKQKINAYMQESVNNVVSSVQYFFFDSNGPEWNRVGKLTPIVRTYFYYPFADESVEVDEARAASTNETSVRIQAHNGWVMGDDPLRNFAASGSTVYLRRQLIPWGDSVKLRYGSKPDDSPDLWAYMSEYTKLTASIFHGVRLDNCHSTPIHVAQHFLDLARSIRPNLYVIAELFTNSEQVDNKFVKELGITSLIRESLNAFNANELGRFVHRFSGEPVGSFLQPATRPLVDNLPHAIFYDQTHDNQPLIKLHSIYDALPSSCLIYMTKSAVGTTRGFDELVPHYIDVVNETRPYKKWCCDNASSNLTNNNICAAKKLMNDLHFEMGIKGFRQTYIDQFDADTTVVTRHNPKTFESVICVARTAFADANGNQNLARPLFIPGKIEHVLYEMSMEKMSQNYEFEQSPEHINGIENYRLQISKNCAVASSRFLERIDYDDRTCSSTIHFKSFPQGAVCIFRVVLNETILNRIQKMRNLIHSVDDFVQQLNFDELNIVLYRCDQEEKSEIDSGGVYRLDSYGDLVYAGVQGVMNILEKERLKNNLGHALFENLRQGNWLMSYMVNRLVKHAQIRPNNDRKNLLSFARALETLFDSVAQIPRYLIPKYFDLVVTNLHLKLIDRVLTLMNNSALIRNDSSSFVKHLALSGVSLCGNLRQSSLPNTIVDETIVNSSGDVKLSMSAGLPHFSSTFMRNWGRDTFISLRGLLLLTGRFNDAKNLILAYGSCLRHGLIPNLLGEGKFSRYNCRDAIWWWLKSIRDYTELAPNGHEILDATLYRLYPTDDAECPNDEDLESKASETRRQQLKYTIHEAIAIHLNGLKFRERNAGKQIDEHMRDQGFNNEIGVDLRTGFVYGGNEYNCGTWMDKMGSSTKANNAGIPSTPRDGSAVELVALSRCALDWLIKMNQHGYYPFDGVTLATSGRKITWIEWAQKIDENFEKHFWIGEASCESMHVNKRNIYKDCLNSAHPWCDYQLRPNFLIALCVAPQMFTKTNAQRALESAREFLLNEPNQLGIKTLDESDFNYNGYYDNSNDSCDKRVANGANYHNGPEWLWPVGFYLRAELHFNGEKALERVKKHLGKLYDALLSTDWKSLPELTNKNGQPCLYSCPSQAWSLATILEVFYDLANFE